MLNKNAVLLIVVMLMTLVLFSGAIQAAPAEFLLTGLDIRNSADIKMGYGMGMTKVFSAWAEASQQKPWILGVAAWSEADGKWTVLRQDSNYRDAVIGFIVVNVLPGEDQQVVLFQKVGSGQFLSYEVVGASDAGLRTLLSREGIFMGRVTEEEGLLVEACSDLKQVFVWTGGQFVAQRYVEKSPILVEGDQLFRYGVDEEGEVWTEAPLVKLRKGGRLYLRREGDGNATRILFQGRQVIEHDGISYVAVGAGSSEITIIPGGYKHERAKRIVVEVRDE